MLLSTVALRYRFLKTELEKLDKNTDDHRTERKQGKFIDKQPTSPTGKKKRVDEKIKIRESGKSFTKLMKTSKMRNISPIVVPSSSSSSSIQQNEDSMDAVPYMQNNSTSSQAKDKSKLLLKNDTPNKFWLSVEPYCMPITQEDIKLLDDLIDEYSGPLIPPIPDLGAHYSSRWAADDLREEQDNSNPNSKTKGKQHANSVANGEVMNLMRKGEKIIGEGITGPLTQRLVSALMEENFKSDNGTDTENVPNNNGLDVGSASSLLKNGISIERRVRKELIEQGILDPEDCLRPEQDDEILSEIKRVRTELSAIAEYNSSELNKLHSAAKAEMDRLEVKRQLDAVELEISEMSKKIVATKLKRRPITKQEREEIFRLTDEQKRLSDQLESMPIPGAHFK